MGRPSADLAEVEETRIEGPEGSIPVRIYRPKKAPDSGKVPLVMFFHGGGWILGGLDTSEETLRMLCDLSGAVIVSVDYRLAPEHIFPSGLEDCYISAVWAANNASALGCDPRKLVVSVRVPAAILRRPRACWRGRGRDRRSHTRSSSIPTSTWLGTCLSTRARSSARHPPSLSG